MTYQYIARINIIFYKLHLCFCIILLHINSTKRSTHTHPAKCRLHTDNWMLKSTVKQILPRRSKSWKWFISRYFFNQNSTETRLSNPTDYFCIFWLTATDCVQHCPTMSSKWYIFNCWPTPPVVMIYLFTTRHKPNSLLTSGLQYSIV